MRDISISASLAAMAADATDLPIFREKSRGCLEISFAARSQTIVAGKRASFRQFFTKKRATIDRSEYECARGGRGGGGEEKMRDR